MVFFILLLSCVLSEHTMNFNTSDFFSYLLICFLRFGNELHKKLVVVSSSLSWCYTFTVNAHIEIILLLQWLDLCMWLELWKYMGH